MGKVGRFGIFGGQYVPETVMNAVHELEEAYAKYGNDPEFLEEYRTLLRDYAGRPSMLYYADRMTKDLGGCKIYLQREDLNHTGAHKINNVLGQLLLAKKMGKKRIIAETGAGQHGVATATACAMFDMECEIYMGKEDVRRQRLNVYRMELLGAKVNSVEGARFSLKTDSQGRTLTEQQREYFKDSKAVDDQGRLMVMYHGTTAYGEITKFRKGRSGWLGPGIYLSSRKEDAQRYADAMGEGNGSLYELYANVTNPLVVTQNNPVPEILLAAYGRESVYKNRSAKQGNDTHIITPADIKKLQSKGYDGIRWDFGGNTELSVFSPEQLKRVDNTSPTGNQDIRYSIKGSETARETAKLREENDLLRERVEYWRGQTRRTKRVTTDKKAVTRAARELIRSYGADLETTDISGELQSLYDYIASGYDGSDELTYTEARRRAEAIARKLVESAVTVDDDMYQQYSDLRSYLRTTKLTISEEDSHNIAD